MCLVRPAQWLRFFLFSAPASTILGMVKKLVTSVIAATMALGLAAAPAHAQSSLNFDLGLSSLPTLSSSRGGAPAPAPQPQPQPQQQQPQKTRGQVAAEIKAKIIAANTRLGHTYSREMEAHAQKYANHAMNKPMKYQTVASGIDIAKFSGNLGAARTKGVVIRVQDRAVGTYLRSLYTVPELAGKVRLPFGVAVNPATGEYYIAIAALIR